MAVPARAAAARAVLVGYALLVVVVIALFTLAPHRPAGAVALASAMPVLALYLTRSAPHRALRTTTLLALLLSWLGDAAGFTFLIKLGFFLAAQILYVMAFWPYRRRLRHTWPPALLYVLGILTILVVLTRYSGPLVVPVMIYGASLGTMAVLAWTLNWRCGVGGLLFLLSDIVLALNEFVIVGGLAYVAAINAVLYLPGQAMIVVGVARRCREA